MANQENKYKSKVTHKGDKQAESAINTALEVVKSVGMGFCLLGRYARYSWRGIKKITLTGTKHKIFFVSWLSIQLVAIYQILFSANYKFTPVAIIIFLSSFPLLHLLFKEKEKIDKNQWFHALYNKLGFKEDIENNLQYPEFIDLEMNNKITTYTFWNNGNKMDVFIKNKELVEEYLTNQFGRYTEIIEINKKKTDRRIMEIKTINERLEEFYRWGTSLVPKQDSIFFGKSINGNLIVEWKKFHNLLICGEIGGGKSVATKNIIFQLLHQSITGNKICIVIADHKGAVDYQFMRHYVKLIKDKKNLLKFTEDLIIEMQKRTDLLLELELENANEYNETVSQENRMERIIFIIDEIIECFDISGLDKKLEQEEIELTIKIKSNVTKLARLSRFVNINLILATQIPSMEHLGNQIRTNIPARLSGKMSDSSSASMVSKMATELEDIDGRMVWKRGSTVLEVQTPLINNKFCKSYLNQMGDKLNLFNLNTNEIKEKKEEKQQENIKKIKGIKELREEREQEKNKKDTK